MADFFSPLPARNAQRIRALPEIWADFPVKARSKWADLRAMVAQARAGA